MEFLAWLLTIAGAAAILMAITWLIYKWVFYGRCPKGWFHSWEVTRTWMQGRTEVTCKKCGETSMADCGMW